MYNRGIFLVTHLAEGESINDALGPLVEEDHSKREQLAQQRRGVYPSSLPFSLSLLEERLKL